MDRKLAIQVMFAGIDKITAPLRRIGGGAKSAARDLASTRKEVLQLEKSSGRVGAYRDLQRAIAGTHEEIDQARRRVTALRAAMAQAEGPTGRLAQQLGAAERKVERLTARTGTQTDKLQALQRELTESGIDVRNLAKDEERLGRALVDANKHLDRQQRKASARGARQKRVEQADARGQQMQSNGLQMAATGTAIAAPLLVAAEHARDFDSRMADIGITAGLAGDKIHALGRRVEALALKVAQQSEALQGGLQVMIGAGLDLPTAENLLAPIGRSATAQNAAVEDLSNAAYSNFNNLKIPVGEAADAIDAMTYAGKKGGVELKDMAKHFPGLTAAAAGLGQKGVAAAADMAAALQIAKNGAADGDEAANNVLNLLNKINAKDTLDNFKKFGIDLPKALKRAYAEGKTPIEAIAELTQKATKGDMAKLSFLFGDAQVQAALRAIIPDLEKYTALRKEAIANGKGTNDRDFAQRLATDPNARSRASGASIDRLQNTVGGAVNPSLEAARSGFAGIADGISDWAERHPALSKAIGGTALAVSILLGVFGVLAVGFGMLAGPFTRGLTLFGRFGGWLKAIGPSILRFGGWILRGMFGPLRMLLQIAGFALTAIASVVGLPVWAVGVAIAALVGLGVLIYTYWDQIKAKGREAFNAIGQAFSAAGQWISSTANSIWTKVSGAFSSMLASATQSASRLWSGVKALFAGGLAWLASLPARFVQLGVQMGQGLVNGIGSMFGALKSKIVGLGKSAVGWFKGVLGIKSPSRVFAGLGGDVMAGLGIGLDRGADKPIARVKAAARGLAGAMAGTTLALPAIAAAPPPNPLAGPPFVGAFASAPIATRAAEPPALVVRERQQPIAAARPPASSSANPPALAGQPVMFTGDIRIEIHAQPGQDEHALARFVRDQIEQVARAAAASQDSSYRDFD